MRPEALVIGSGVIGLTCAVRLAEAGFPTRILTREPPATTTSSIAGALWYPYKAYPEDRVLAWSAHSLGVYYDLAARPDTGVFITTFLELFEGPTPDPWWRGAVRRFRRAAPGERAPGYADGYVVEAPFIEPAPFLAYLLARFEAAGGQITVEAVDRLDRLRAPGRLVVNCSGLGARTLVGDEAVYPIRGQVVRVENPGLTQSVIEEYGPLAMTYIFPRRHDCILGGTADDHVWDLTPDPATTREILRRSVQLEPRLREAAVLEVRVGLRPGRHAVRLEAEAPDGRGLLLHNYGHGGAGFTLCWGCAEDVLALALSQA